MNQTSFHPQKILRTVSIGLHIKKDVTSSFEIVASAAAVLHRPAHRPDPTAYRQFRRENLMGKSVQKDKNTFKHSSSKRVEVDEDAFREMLLGQELPARDVAQNDPKQDDAEPTIRNKTVDSKSRTAGSGSRDNTGRFQNNSGQIRIPAKKDFAARFRADVFPSRKVFRWTGCHMSASKPSTKFQNYSICWGMSAQD